MSAPSPISDLVSVYPTLIESATRPKFAHLTSGVSSTFVAASSSSYFALDPSVDFLVKFCIVTVTERSQSPPA
ncbi:hypothetical protein RU639_012735 [Aspergillus parasiticus]